MKRNDKVAIVGCSNGQARSCREKLEQLHETLKDLGLIPIWGNYIYETEHGINGSGKDKAKELMRFFRDDEIKAIFDISGGDIANEVLPYLDFEEISNCDKLFYGYSDLTTILNAIYAKTGRCAALYQIRNLIDSDSEKQMKYFKHTVLEGKDDLFDFSYRFVQQSEMRGIVAGGNIRCLLKLAGTEYWPDMTGKILLLEAYSGGVPQMVTYLNQLKQMKVFEQVAGILLGTFTKMEQEGSTPAMQELVKKYVGENIPIACTAEIGHAVNAKGIMIGREYYLK